MEETTNENGMPKELQDKCIELADILLRILANRHGPLQLFALTTAIYTMATGLTEQLHRDLFVKALQDLTVAINDLNFEPQQPEETPAPPVGNTSH